MIINGYIHKKTERPVINNEAFRFKEGKYEKME